jgi:hypothetical protein
MDARDRSGMVLPYYPGAKAYVETIFSHKFSLFMAFDESEIYQQQRIKT